MDIDKVLFVVVRHGTTLLNKEDKFRGWSDDEAAALDSKGLKQARVAGRFLDSLPIKFGFIITSDLDRAIHTGAIIGRVLGIKDIHIDSNLRPLNVGDFTGEDKSSVSIDKYIDNPDLPFPNGESITAFRERQDLGAQHIKQLLKAHPGQRGIEIGHLSSVLYWQDLEKTIKGYLEDYATDKKDLIHPGGIIAVMEDGEIVPLLGENIET